MEAAVRRGLQGLLRTARRVGVLDLRLSNPGIDQDRLAPHLPHPIAQPL